MGFFPADQLIEGGGVSTVSLVVDVSDFVLQVLFPLAPPNPVLGCVQLMEYHQEVVAVVVFGESHLNDCESARLLRGSYERPFEVGIVHC